MEDEIVSKHHGVDVVELLPRESGQVGRWDNHVIDFRQII